MLQAHAAAKLNLFLHVTGRRADGYHLLQSLVVFTDIGDRLSATRADAMWLEVNGPFGKSPALAGENLVMKAARLLQETTGCSKQAHLILEKHLPIGAGIGGGSADAAAALKLLCELWEITLSDTDLHALALRLGSDVPACLHSRPLIMSGTGEQLEPLTLEGQLHLVLANPGKTLLTAPVFQRFHEPMRTPMQIAPRLSFTALLELLNATGNDLEAPAMELVPEIGSILETLRSQPGCLLARMSGSGATCFGLFRHPQEAADAENLLATQYPDWWVKAARSIS